jgi:DNA polymerase elongation subunit (family B)
MLGKITLPQILFIDIETVPAVPSFSELSENLKSLWSNKTLFLQQRDAITAEEAYSKAGIYAEFGKVICISTAIFHQSSGGLKLRVKSFYHDDETQVLKNFGTLLEKHFGTDDKYLCGHNLKEFDLPYIARRMVIHGMKLPKIIDLSGMKPWEVRHLDTLELWKFGDHKHYTSLALLTTILGIPTPKDDISGADVSKVYWEDRDLERIRVYCEKDTVAVAQLILKFKNLPLIPNEAVEFV